MECATENDLEELNTLVNGAYRGFNAGWTSEVELLDGQRCDEEMLREILEKNNNFILLKRGKEGAIICCCHLELTSDRIVYLGMITVLPTLQKSGLGSELLKEAEAFAKRQWKEAKAIKMTVITRRTKLIDWYLKRGFIVTGKREPFPYGEERFGIPRVTDLEFCVLQKQRI